MYTKKPSTQYRLDSLAERIQGELIGDGTQIVQGICPSDQPTTHHLTFLQRCRPAQLQALAETTVAGVIIPSAADITDTNVTCIRVEDPFKAILNLLPLFYEPASPAAGIDSRAAVDPSVQRGDDISIGAFCVIGKNVVIGDRVTLHPHVVIYPNVTIGSDVEVHSGAVVREGCVIHDHCTIQNGAVIGADGFGYMPDPEKGLTPVPQVGIVELHAGTDVGANSCIDRATLGRTITQKQVKIDNLVQIGHNVEIGQTSILCGQSGVGGSTKIGARVTLAGGAGIGDHVTVADGVRLGARAGTSSDIKEAGDYLGHPAVPMRQWLRQMKALEFLPGMLRKWRGKK